MIVADKGVLTGIERPFLRDKQSKKICGEYLLTSNANEKCEAFRVCLSRMRERVRRRKAI